MTHRVWDGAASMDVRYSQRLVCDGTLTCGYDYKCLRYDAELVVYVGDCKGRLSPL